MDRLKPAHKELVESGFLEKVEREGERIRYVIGEEFARQQLSRDVFSDPGQAIALELLLGERVRGDVARELVLDHGSDRCIRYVKALPYQKIERSRSGWLIRAIKEGYELRDDQLPPSEESADDNDGRLCDADDVQSLSSPGENGSREAGRDLTHISEPDPGAEEIWEKVLGEVSEEINAPSLRVWFEGTIPVSLTADSLTISTPNSVAKEYIETRFREPLERALSNHLSLSATLDITVAGEATIHNTNRTKE
jgi:hypothetical protein